MTSESQDSPHETTLLPATTPPPESPTISTVDAPASTSASPIPLHLDDVTVSPALHLAGNVDLSGSSRLVGVNLHVRTRRGAFSVRLDDARLAYDLSERLSVACADEDEISRPSVGVDDVLPLVAPRWLELVVERHPDSNDGLHHVSYPEGFLDRLSYDLGAYLVIPCGRSVLLFLHGLDGHDRANPLRGTFPDAHGMFVLPRTAAKALAIKLLRFAHDLFAEAQGGAAATELPPEPPPEGYVPPPYANAIRDFKPITFEEAKRAMTAPRPNVFVRLWRWLLGGFLRKP